MALAFPPRLPVLYLPDPAQQQRRPRHDSTSQEGKLSVLCRVGGCIMAYVHLLLTPLCTAARDRMRLALESCVPSPMLCLDPAKQQRNPHNNRLCCHCDEAVSLQVDTCVRRH